MEERQRRELLEKVRKWAAAEDIANACRSLEVRELIQQLEKDHHAYPQFIMNADEN